MSRPEPTKIKETDILALLKPLQATGIEGAVSAQEIADSAGMSQQWASRRLKQFIKAGKVGVEFRSEMNVIGRTMYVPVYYLLE